MNLEKARPLKREKRLKSGLFVRLMGRFMTLRWRLTLLNAALLTLLGIGFSVFIYYRLENFLDDSLRSRMLDYAVTQTFLPNDRKSGSGGGNDHQDRSSQNNDKGGSSLANLAELLATKPVGEIHPAVLNPGGQIVVGNDSSASVLLLTPLPTSQQLQQATASKTLFYTTTSVKDPQEQIQVYLMVVADDSGPVYDQNGVPLGFVMLGASLKPATDVLGEIRFLLISGLAGLVLLTIFGGYPLTQLGLRPLKKITNLARQIRGTRLDQRVPLPNSLLSGKVVERDEIWQLVLEFNAMLENIEKAFLAQQRNEARMRQFVADASHELRSPLTILGGYLDVLQMGALDDPAQNARIITSLKQEIDRLSQLVIDLLLLTRLDSRESGGLRHTPLDLDELLNRTVNNMKILAGSREVSLEYVTGKEGIWVNGNADHLYRVLVNLVDNSIRYSAPGGKIELSLKIENSNGKNWAIIEVRDWGYGIPADQLTLIFNRFYRADKSRNRETGNTGLGLAISKGIVETHQGTISVESKQGEGTIFTIRLPLLGLELESDSVTV